jgi:hypothetical protein
MPQIRMGRQVRRTMSPCAGGTRRGGHNDTRNPNDDSPTRCRATQKVDHTNRGSRKKAKAHKDIPEYTITEDDADLVAERVQDHVTEEYEEAENQRERIMKELTEVKQVLEWIQAAQTQDKGKNQSNDRQRKGT